MSRDDGIYRIGPLQFWRQDLHEGERVWMHKLVFRLYLIRGYSVGVILSFAKPPDPNHRGPVQVR